MLFETNKFFCFVCVTVILVVFKWRACTRVQSNINDLMSNLLQLEFVINKSKVGIKET